MKFARRHLVQDAVELNITAFLNLMVILVPFLLVTAVFSRLTIIELNLPALDAVAKQEDKIKLQLQLLLRSDEFIIRDVNLGVIKRFERNKGEIDGNSFGNILLEIKRRFPEENSITLLFEKDINYRTLIQVMDLVRSIDVVEIAEVQTIELFPNISIGDAPAVIALEKSNESTATSPTVDASEVSK